MVIEIQVVRTLKNGSKIVGIQNTKGIKIFNLTPHDIVLKTKGETIAYPKNNISVRIEEGYKEVVNEYGLPFEKENGEKIVTGLPEQEEFATFYIVSTMVRKELFNRKDLISPTTNIEHQERNELGHTVAVTHFQTNL